MSPVRLSILNESERERIRSEALALLADTGVVTADSRIREAFRKEGATVEPTDRVRLPAELTTELLARTPSNHVCETIGGERIEVGAGGQMVTSIVLDPVILDYERGPRPPRLSDVAAHTRLGDALPLINATYKMDQGLEGLTPLESNVRSLCEFLCNTTNHVSTSPADQTSLSIWLEMMEVVLDGAGFAERPIMGLGGHVKSPLLLPPHECGIIIEAVAHSIPFRVGSCPMAGATSPFTLAGTLVLATAETLFMACAVQACGSSHPVLARSSIFPFNMKSGNVSAGGIETSLLEAGYVELMRDLGLPVGITCTFNEPVALGFQSGLETTAKCLSAVLIAPDILSGLGSVANAAGVSAEKILLDHDCLAMARRFQEGVRVEDDTMAASAIREAGAEGNFMGSDHTITYLRTGEHYYGGLFFREGARDRTMCEVAHEKTHEILRSHVPKVPGERQEALHRVAEKIEARLRGS